MRTWILIAALFLAGCATSYEGGVMDRQVGRDIWAIRGAGNAFTHLSDAEDFVMLRAAEIGRERGYSYFIILAYQSNLRGEPMTVGGGTFNATTTCYGTLCNTYGTAAPPTTTTIYKPDAVARVQFIRQSEYDEMTEDDRARALSVEQVWADLSPRYID